MEKIYSVFVSSQYSSMKEKRQTVINTLLKINMLPVAMENFVISDFESIKLLLDKTDIMILLLGAEYGSLLDGEKSYTEYEYEYAREKGITVYTIATREYEELTKQNSYTLTDEQKKQLMFGERISGKIPESLSSIDSIVFTIPQTIKHNALAGWIRGDIFDESGLTKEDKIWQKENASLDLRGKWYHILYNKKEDYLRYGTVNINQKFTKEYYSGLEINARNYSVSEYDKSTNCLSKDVEKFTEWGGTFILEKSGKITGIYRAHRQFAEKFGNVEATNGIYIGIQNLQIIDDDDDEDMTDVTSIVRGTFADVTPSPKQGNIILFRSKQARDNYIVKKLYNIMENRGYIND